MINGDDRDDRSRNHAFYHHDARSSFHNHHDDDGVLRDHVCHGGHDDPHRNVLYHGDLSYHDDLHDGPNDDVHPSYDGLPSHHDARDDRHASHGDHLCGNHHRICVLYGIHLCVIYDDNREFSRPSYGLFHGQISTLYGRVRVRDDCRAHHVHRDDPSYARHARDDDLHDVLCHDDRVLPFRDDDDLYGPYDLFHHVLHDDENDVHDLRHARDDDHDGENRILLNLLYFGHLAPKIR